MEGLLQKISIRELQLGLTGVCVIVIVGLVMVLLVPRGKALLTARESVNVLRAASQDSNKLERHLREASEKNDELRYRLYGDMANLPANQVEAYIIGRLQEISWAANIDLISIEPGLGDQVQIFQETLFKVQVIGRYDDLYRWLWGVRQELGYVVVKEYSLKRTGNSDAEPQLQAKLSLASYRAIE